MLMAMIPRGMVGAALYAQAVGGSQTVASGCAGPSPLRSQHNTNGSGEDDSMGICSAVDLGMAKMW